MTYSVGDRVRVTEIEADISDSGRGPDFPNTGDEGVVVHVEELDSRDLWVDLDNKPAPELFQMLGAPAGWPLHESEVEAVA